MLAMVARLVGPGGVLKGPGPAEVLAREYRTRLNNAPCGHGSVEARGFHGNQFGCSLAG